MDRMSRLAAISPEQVEKSRAALQNPPPSQSRGATKKEAIRSLVPEIRALQRQGYSIKAIAKILSDSGLPMSGVTLNSYLQRIRSRADPKRAKRADRRGGTSPKAPQTKRQPQTVPESSTTSKAAAVTSTASASTTSATPPNTARTPHADPKATNERAAFFVKKDTENI